jgi:hypothetical protein
MTNLHFPSSIAGKVDGKITNTGVGDSDAEPLLSGGKIGRTTEPIARSIQEHEEKTKFT